LLDLSEQESGNSIDVLNTLLSEASTKPVEHVPDDGKVLECLEGLSIDLAQRWKGALFALRPDNPEAARHFCTSSREILSELLDLFAPDKDVVAEDPSCDRIQHSSKPTRRSKINYLLTVKGIDDADLAEFVEADLDNFFDLFGVFNAATHGESGRHNYSTLKTVKRRVEGGIMFLSALAA